MKRTYIFIILTIVIIGLVIKFPHIMISPGNLYEAHAELKNDCFSCHKIGAGTPNESCISCHKISEISKNNSTLKFHEKIKNQSCITCHSDHKGLHYKLAMNNFNHFLLPEKDRNSCASCHQSPKDNFHRNSSTNCLSCHTLNKWKPSTFNHDNYFKLDNDHNVSCNTCHKTNDYKTYTCFGCHEHSMNNIREQHKEGIANLTDCVRCHKSANENAIQMKGSDVKKYINKEFQNNKEKDDD